MRVSLSRDTVSGLVTSKRLVFCFQLDTEEEEDASPRVRYRVVCQTPSNFQCSGDLLNRRVSVWARANLSFSTLRHCRRKTVNNYADVSYLLLLLRECYVVHSVTATEENSLGVVRATTHRGRQRRELRLWRLASGVRWGRAHMRWEGLFGR